MEVVLHPKPNVNGAVQHVGHARGNRQAAFISGGERRRPGKPAVDLVEYAGLRRPRLIDLPLPPEIDPPGRVFPVMSSRLAPLEVVREREMVVRREAIGVVLPVSTDTHTIMHDRLVPEIILYPVSVAKGVDSINAPSRHEPIREADPRALPQKGTDPAGQEHCHLLELPHERATGATLPRSGKSSDMPDSPWNSVDLCAEEPVHRLPIAPVSAFASHGLMTSTSAASNGKTSRVATAALRWMAIAAIKPS